MIMISKKIYKRKIIEEEEKDNIADDRHCKEDDRFHKLFILLYER